MSNYNHYDYQAEAAFELRKLNRNLRPKVNARLVVLLMILGGMWLIIPIIPLTLLCWAFAAFKWFWFLIF